MKEGERKERGRERKKGRDHGEKGKYTYIERKCVQDTYIYIERERKR